VHQFFIQGGTGAAGMAVDARHIYWANFRPGTIGQANLNGRAASSGTQPGPLAPKKQQLNLSAGLGIINAHSLTIRQLRLELRSFVVDAAPSARVNGTRMP